MFDVGFWEVALIGIVTLLVVGPDRLPDVARTAGKWVLKVRRFVAGVKSDFNRELQTGDLHKILGDQKEQINELRSIVNSTRQNIESSASDAVAAAKTNFESVEKLGKSSMSTKPAPTSTAASIAAPDTAPDAAPDTNSATNPATETKSTIPAQKSGSSSSGGGSNNWGSQEINSESSSGSGSDTGSVSAGKDS